MKKSLNSLRKTVLLCCTYLLAGVGTKAQIIKNNQIVMGVVDSVHSKILNESRKIWVYVPASASDTRYAKHRYPVVYLLDGDEHFSSVTGMIQQLSEINLNQVCPDMIVVAIPSTNRVRDLTPTNVLHDKISGGGEKFTDFIKTELMPHIDSIYPTASYKMLIGHSFGGLMVVNTLINHPDMFNAYVAIDPSLWWDDQKLLKQSREVLRQNNYAGKWLYMGIANTMPPGMDTLQVRKDTTQPTKHIRSILIMKDMLKSDQAANGLKFDYRYYNGDSHGTVPLITEYDALHFLFSYYGIPNELMIKISQSKADAGVLKQIEARYDDASKQMGYKVSPPEETINQMAYSLMMRNPDAALLLFSMNMRNYPGSYNVYDSMGDYYASVKNNSKAIECYKKALTIKEYKETRDKLNKLTGGK